jgi:predicted CoA-substrate-specific enzyme activase
MTYTLGIDIGSTASKCVVLADGKDIVSKSLVPFGAGTSGPGRAIAEAEKASGLEAGQIAYTLSTGYGRHSVGLAQSEMSELSCHAAGSYFLFPGVHTVIDIGGQDVKVLRIGEGGMLENFAMNEKCAAGTGRFLEVMARVLEINVEDMEKLSAESTERVDISSTCTVFAESEVISQLAQNKKKVDIINGIHRSIALRVSGLVRRIGVKEEVVMSGGVARNGGVVLAMKNELEVNIEVSPLAQYTGALGAALLARRKYNR